MVGAMASGGLCKHKGAIRASTQALWGAPSACCHCPPTEDSVVWNALQGIEALFRGSCFSDASAIFATADTSRQCAWAVIQFSSHVLPASVVMCSVGVFPGPLQSNNEAELYCMWFWLVNLDVSAFYHELLVDSAWAGDGFGNIGGMLAEHWIPHLDLWNRVDEKLRDLDGLQVHVCHEM